MKPANSNVDFNAKEVASMDKDVFVQQHKGDFNNDLFEKVPNEADRVKILGDIHDKCTAEVNKANAATSPATDAANMAKSTKKDSATK